MADHNPDLPRMDSIAPMEVLNRLDAAVAGDGLELVFQPIVSLPDEAVVGFEALARWDQFDDPNATLAGAGTRDGHRTTAAAGPAVHPHGDRVCTDRRTSPRTRWCSLNSEAVTASRLPGRRRRCCREAPNAFSWSSRSPNADCSPTRPPCYAKSPPCAMTDSPSRSTTWDANLDSLALLDVICPDVIRARPALIVQSLPRYRTGPDLGRGAGLITSGPAPPYSPRVSKPTNTSTAQWRWAQLWARGSDSVAPRPTISNRPLSARAAPRIRTEQPSLDTGSPFDRRCRQRADPHLNAKTPCWPCRATSNSKPSIDGSTDGAHRAATRRVLHLRHQRPIPATRRLMSVGRRIRPRHLHLTWDPVSAASASASTIR